MNSYEISLQYGFTGEPQDVVNQLKAIKKHHRNVYITGGPSNTESVNLLHLLTARHRVMGMGPAQQWIGPLIDLESTNSTVATILSILRPMLQVNDTLVYCKDSDEAADMLNALTAIVGQITGKSEQVLAEVALLSGGRIGADFNNLTVDELNEDKATYLQAETAKAAYEALKNRRQNWDTLSANIRSRIESGELIDNSTILAVVQEQL